MIPKYAEEFRAKEAEIRAKFSDHHPGGYMDIVRAVVENLEGLDPNRIHEIDDGDYQGTLVYVIAEESYQPHEYVTARVWYGSCSGCDTLEAIRMYGDDAPTPEQLDDYMKLARDIVSSMCQIGGEAA